MTFPEIAAALDGSVRSRSTPDYGGKPLGNTVSWRIDPRGRNRSAVVQQNASGHLSLDLYVKNDPIGERQDYDLADGGLEAVGFAVSDHLNAPDEAAASEREATSQNGQPATPAFERRDAPERERGEAPAKI